MASVIFCIACTSVLAVKSLCIGYASDIPAPGVNDSFFAWLYLASSCVGLAFLRLLMVFFEDVISKQSGGDWDVR